MKDWKKIIVFLFTVVFSLSLAACGKDVAGKDWRTTGVVVDRGTITHEGDSVNVLITISPDSAAFYRDLEEQILFDSVSFPMTIPDAQTAFEGISFQDLNGDDESDVTVEFSHADNSKTKMVWIWDAKERYVFQPDLSEVSEEITSDPAKAYLSKYVGLWEYVGENVWLRIHDDATWEFVNSENDVIENGVVLADAEGIELHYDESGDVLRLKRSTSGDLLDSANNGTLRSVKKIVSNVSCFEKNGLKINATVDKGTFLLKNGVAIYTNEKNYSTSDCYWEVVKKSDDVHDGIREINLITYCYIPNSSIPKDSLQYSINTSGNLYDYYTGMWFTDSTTYDDTSRGENHYRHTVSWNGKKYDIEYFYSTEWTYETGDWGAVLTKDYMIYLSKDYDGLVFAGIAQADNYKDTLKRHQLDSICPEASIMECQTIDPYHNLYFRICNKTK